MISLQWSADGSALLAASARDNSAKLFALRKLHGYVPITFTGHKTPVIGAFFGSNGNDDTIYTVSIDGACFTWLSKEDSIAKARDGSPMRINF